MRKLSLLGKTIGATIVATLVMVLLVVPMVPGTSVAFAAGEEDQTERILLDLNAVDDRWEIWTGETAKITADFELSGTTLQIPNGKLVITVEDAVPADRFQTRPTFGTYPQARVEVENSRGVQGRSYTFDMLHGGMEGSIPLTVEFPNRSTPDGTQAIVRFTLIDAEGNQRATTSKTLTAKAAGNIQPKKIVSSCYQSKEDEQGTECVVATPGGAGGLPANYTVGEAQGDENPYLVQYCVGYLQEVNPDAPNGLGIYVAKSLRLVDTLPEGMKLAPNPLGWSYVEGSTTQVELSVYFDLPNYSKFSTCGGGSFNGFVLPLVANDAQVVRNGEQVNHVNTVRLVRNPDTDNEDLGEASANARFVAHQKVPAGRVDVYKRFFGRGDFSIQGNRITGGDSSYEYFVDRENNDRTIFGYAISVKQMNDVTPTEENLGVHDQTHTLNSISDVDMDERLYYRRVILKDHDTTKDVPFDRNTPLRELVNQARAFVYGVTDSGEEVKLHERPMRFDSPDSQVLINDTERRYTKLIIRFENPMILDNSNLTFLVDTPPIPAEVEKWAANGYEADRHRAEYANYATANVTFADGQSKASEIEESNRKDNTLVLRTLQGGVSLEAFGKHSVVWQDCQGVDPEHRNSISCSAIVDYRVKTKAVEDWTIDDVARNFKHIILLPHGVEVENVMPPTSLEKRLKTEVITNYAGTGKRALVLSYGDLIHDDFDNFTVGLSFYATLGTPEGLNIFPVYATWDNRDQILPINPQADEYDINLDGRRDDNVLKGEFTLDFTPPAGMSLVKYISADGLTWKDQLINREIDTDVYYRLLVVNSMDRPRDSLVVMDVMPHSGDTTIVPNKNGEYTPRHYTTWEQIDPENEFAGFNRVDHKHSSFDTPLVQEIFALTSIKDGVETDATDRFDVMYSLVAHEGNLPGVLNGQWVTADQVTDWSQVRNFRIALKPGGSIAPHEQIVITTKNHIPADDHTKTAARKDMERAYNSAAISSDGKVFNETNTVYTRLIDYTVEGTFYYDTNFSNSLQGIGTDAPLPDREVSLVDAKTGVVVKDLDGQPYVTRTDSMGRFAFTVYRAGDYRVAFVKEKDERFIDPKSAVYQSLSHQVNLCANAYTTSADEFKALTAENCLQDASANNNVGYSVPFTLSPKKDERKYTTIAGVQKEYFFGDALIEKVGGEDYARLPGAKFELTWKGPLTFGEKPVGPIPDPIPAPVTAVSGAVSDIPGYSPEQTLGLALFKNLPIGIYTLRELEAPVGYLKETMTNEEGEEVEKLQDVYVVAGDISLYPQKFPDSYAYNPIDPEVVSGFIRFTKVDGETDKALQGATFVVKQNGVEKARATSRADGVVNFGPLAAGDYTVEELEAPVGYEKTAAKVTVSISERKTYELPNVENNKVQTPPENPSENPQDPPSNPPLNPNPGTPTPGTPTPGTPTPGTPTPGTPTPGTPTPGTPTPGTPTPGTPTPGTPTPGTPTPGTPTPGEPTPGEPTPGAPTPGQPTPGKPSVPADQQPVQKPSPKLAKTGADTQELSAVAGMLLATGVMLIARGRRRK